MYEVLPDMSPCAPVFISRIANADCYVDVRTLRILEYMTKEMKNPWMCEGSTARRNKKQLTTVSMPGPVKIKTVNGGKKMLMHVSMSFLPIARIIVNRSRGCCTER